ncbi:hypothetical protein [Lysinibacillus sp. 3P01SB]|uniref:hypothetical protein n=1 Tax=Lysinibacillus sp. 3P01SB TaxID=3132284 RepID=UPI0039A6603E
MFPPFDLVMAVFLIMLSAVAIVMTFFFVVFPPLELVMAVFLIMLSTATVMIMPLFILLSVTTLFHVMVWTAIPRQPIN